MMCNSGCEDDGGDVMVTMMVVMMVIMLVVMVMKMQEFVKI